MPDRKTVTTHSIGGEQAWDAETGEPVKRGYTGPGRYRHYKGGEYVVVGLALQEDTLHKDEQNPMLVCEHCGSRATDPYCGCNYIAGWACRLEPRHRPPEVTYVIYMPVQRDTVLWDREESMWARRLDDFNATVEVDGKMVPRFEIVRYA